MSFRLLVINPGSTSTKIAIYEDEKELFKKNVSYSKEEIEKFETIYDQSPYRKKIIDQELEKINFDINTLDAVIGRGGLLKPIEGGTYKVNDRMLEDLKIGVMGHHVCNLGGILAYEIANSIGKDAYIVDPVVVDELSDVARISGIPEIERKSIFHALNQKAVAKRYAKENGVKYESLNLIVVHMGGGVSVGAHKNGRVIDVNNALDGEGPFSPERSGGLPVGDLIKMCYSGKYTLNEMKKKISGKGGTAAYLNSNDFRDVRQKIENGDKKAELIYEAFIYQVVKEIGKCAAVLKGQVDAIILTGGIAYNEYTIARIKEMVSFISQVVVYPGENELLALAQGGLSVLNKEEDAKIY